MSSPSISSALLVAASVTMAFLVIRDPQGRAANTLSALLRLDGYSWDLLLSLLFSGSSSASGGMS
ncbi:hypothetical protein N7505_010249 [Penicillium chrysogenum]|uniref:Uncharacterized protein n=1 Tax=Penicillium chrysogenum TaxID=5076 RepID=A0ABQ8W330_PENCH|nr:hypothetical protein N7505_010249 [Penicillium chrysogenum]KAJ5276132.1 hypothetical protein N7524_002285 [Penicillium chrysogenum]